MDQSTHVAATGRLEIMSDRDCVRLLRANRLGRVALVDPQARPVIFPVNYFFDEGVVVFRTGHGTKLDLAPGAHVGFEIDNWNPTTGVGWSVLVKGIAHDLTQPRGMPVSRMRMWPVQPLAPGARDHWIGIWANEITGRMFRAPAPPETALA